MKRIRALFAAVLIAVIPLAPAAFAGETTIEDGAPVVVYLVRHAEKMAAEESADPRDPHLDSKGLHRAAELVHVLAGAGVTSILSSPYHRTIETATPLADRLGLEIEKYDPTRLADLAVKLRSSPGRHLVVGHSNTTPQLVELLGGDGGAPIDEAGEYDRLYIVSISGERTSTILLRYGD